MVGVKRSNAQPMSAGNDKTGDTLVSAGGFRSVSVSVKRDCLADKRTAGVRFCGGSEET